MADLTVNDSRSRPILNCGLVVAASTVKPATWPCAMRSNSRTGSNGWLAFAAAGAGAGATAGAAVASGGAAAVAAGGGAAVTVVGVVFVAAPATAGTTGCEGRLMNQPAPPTTASASTPPPISIGSLLPRADDGAPLTAPSALLRLRGLPAALPTTNGSMPSASRKAAMEGVRCSGLTTSARSIAARKPSL